MTFFKGSYYENVPLFEPDDEGRSVFAGVQARPMAKVEPVLEHSVALKERLDSVAQHYYAQPRDWRRIAEANPDALFAEDPGDRVSHVALAAAVRTNDGGDSVPSEDYFGVVGEGFEPSDFQAFEFEHSL